MPEWMLLKWVRMYADDQWHVSGRPVLLRHMALFGRYDIWIERGGSRHLFTLAIKGAREQNIMYTRLSEAKDVAEKHYTARRRRDWSEVD